MGRTVVKVGTQVITRPGGVLDRSVMKRLVREIAHLKRKGMSPIVVSSGSVAAGRASLGLPFDARAKPGHQQVLAAVGQIRLMEIYRQLFLEENIHIAQVLATKEDFRDRRHYLCMRDCLDHLLQAEIIPVVNENDVVAVHELMFTDNDELAGLVASMMDAKELIILTSVDGVFDRDPRDPEAKLIEEVQEGKCSVSYGQRSSFGRGGMQTKVTVAKRLATLGTATHIVNGRKDKIILEPKGTTFTPAKRQKSVKKWIASSEGLEKGAVKISAGAVETLKDKGRAKSLLPVGITRIIGNFEKGDLIRIESAHGEILGYGIASYGSQVAAENMGKKQKKALIHYNYLYLYS